MYLKFSVTFFSFHMDFCQKGTITPNKRSYFSAWNLSQISEFFLLLLFPISQEKLIYSLTLKYLYWKKNTHVNIFINIFDRMFMESKDYNTLLDMN